MSNSADNQASSAADHALHSTTHCCFGCGPDNPNGLHLHFLLDREAHTASAHVHLTRLFEGPPGHIHGGIIATLMDEAMSKLNRLFDVVAMTRHMEVDYLRPAPLHQDLRLIGHHSHREGRKLYHRAELLSHDGVVLAQAKGLFVALDPALIAAAKASGRF
jgi:acyl-coenzyme A thioesterase PaaI-like protein